MEDFSTVLRKGREILHFRFTRMYAVKGFVYFVSVTGGPSNQYFQMEERGALWKIAMEYEPPAWLLSFEDELGKTIRDRQV